VRVKKERVKLKIENVEIIFIARRRPAGSLMIMMMPFELEEIFSFKAIGVARFVAGKLHEIFFQRRRRFT
jgi:hypothetical protein